MERQVNTDEIERELRATISARREVGRAYEEQLIEAFTQKLHQQVLLPQLMPPQQKHSPSESRRLALAVVSLALLIPLIAIGVLFALSLHNGGLFFAYLAIICLTVLDINYFFNKRH